MNGVLRNSTSHAPRENWRLVLPVIGTVVLVAAVACGGGGIGPSAPDGGHTGKVRLHLGGVADLAIQRDGKVVAVTDSFQLVRLTTDGSLDLTFGAGGSVQAHFRGRCMPPPGWEATCRSSRSSASGAAVAIQPDGKIVAAGQWQRRVGNKNQSEQVGAGFALARFGPDGDLDRDFGTGGMVTAEDTASGGGTASGGDVAIQRNGKIVVTDGDGLARYRADGRLDRAFGAYGRVQTGLDWQNFGAPVLALQSDGRIVVAGSLNRRPGRSDFAVARFLQNGENDPSFGNNGRVITHFGGKFEGGTGLVVQRDGKLVAAGGTWKYGVSRYMPDGRLDESFGNSGKVMARFDGDAEPSIASQDGKIVVAGNTIRSDGVGEFALGRYLQDGQLDADFGQQGKVITKLSWDSSASAVVTQRDGKIIAGGETSTGAFAIVRYLSDGSLDRSFGTKVRRAGNSAAAAVRTSR